MLAQTRSQLLAGLSAAGSGLRLSTRSPELRRTYLQLVGALFAMTVVLQAGGLWTLWHFTEITDDLRWWGVAGYWVLRLAGTLAVLLVAPLLSLTVVNTVFPLLSDRVFLAAMRVVSPVRAEQLAACAGLSLSTTIYIEVRRLLSFFSRAVLAFAVSLVPVVGQIVGPILQAYFSARGLGWELLGPYLDKLGFGYRQQCELVGRHRAALVGFGLPLTLLMAIPVVGPLLFGLAQGAAAKLVVEVIEGNPGSSA